VGCNKDEITEEWRRLCNEGLCDLPSSPHIVQVIKSRRMKWKELVARTGYGRGAYSIVVGRPESRRLFGRSTCKWGGNIKMDVEEVGWRHRLDLCGSEWGHVAGCFECCNDLSASIICG
jgi:hypothetical protein